MLPVFANFRAGFSGKASPVHFLGALSICRSAAFPTAPRRTHPGGMPGLPDRITREAYRPPGRQRRLLGRAASRAAEPFFYSHAYPEPAGLSRPANDPARPELTRHSANMSCLMAVVRAPPTIQLMRLTEFFQIRL